ncbi:MAG TPA: M20/M25/M40 family metallo-hydrolase [Glycomyces sp.]|nr:M20/M25/M40 family metallo-hydrolase [Glycomyces sp.]
MTNPSDVGLLRSMLEIRSESGRESRLAHHLAGVLRDRGFDSRLDEAGNVIGVLDRGPGPTVLLLGHLDTVPGGPPVREADGRLYGRGAVDAKGPLAAMICAAARSRGPGRIVLAGVVEEETPASRGATHLREHLERPDAMIVGEPSGWSTVVIGYKGRVDLRYRVRREAAHSTSPEPKAVELASLAWRRLAAAAGGELSHREFRLPGATLLSLRGDPCTAEAHFDIRTPPGFDVAAMLRRLRREVPHGRFELLHAVPACRVGRSDPVVRALSAAVGEQGARPTATLKTATSDMNTMAQVWDVPMATYGPGDGHLDHGDDEHLPLDDYGRSIAVLSTALATLSRRLEPDRGRHSATTAKGDSHAKHG